MNLGRDQIRVVAEEFCTILSSTCDTERLERNRLARFLQVECTQAMPKEILDVETRMSDGCGDRWR